MRIRIDRESSEPLYLQIRAQLRAMILEGALPSGHRLPPERKLAEQLGVNRTTILNAYRELKSDDLVEAQVGFGTVVRKRPEPAAPARPESKVAPIWRSMYSREALLTDDSMTRDILALTSNPGIISFAAGIPSAEGHLPQQTERLMTRLLAEKGGQLFSHTPTEGLASLRESIATHMLERGIHALPSETMVLSGSQQGIDLIARMMLDPGDTVLVEEPTFFNARQIFEARGANVVGIACDREGIRIDLAEQHLRVLAPKFIYVVPTYQNPTGAVMSLKRRHELLALAIRYRVPIVEDDPYYGLDYDGETPPPIKSLDPNGHVFYLGSFSKVLFMGLRVGWLLAPKAVVRQTSVMKQLQDLHTASLSQWICDAVLREKLLHDHLAEICRIGREKRDRMIAAIERWMPADAGIDWRVPAGGLYLWMTLPAELDVDRMNQIAARKGVAFVPGRVFSVDGSHARCIRLNFTYPKAELIDRGIRLLAEAISEASSTVAAMPREEREILPIV